MKMPVRTSWGQKLERGLMRLVVAAAVLVMIAQAVLVNDPLKQVATPVASLERPQPRILDSAGILQGTVVTLYLKNFSSLPLAKVLVNGEPRGEFRDRYVTVFVREGDIIEVDGTRYDRPLEIEVLDVSKEVLYPGSGTGFRVDGNVAKLGQVHLRGK